jgi:hypothetical protein
VADSNQENHVVGGFRTIRCEKCRKHVSRQSGRTTMRFGSAARFEEAFPDASLQDHRRLVKPLLQPYGLDLSTQLLDKKCLPGNPATSRPR